jgi:hypothetical protein
MTILEERILAGKKSGRSVIDDGDIGLVVRYKGSEASATVEVAATTGDITFKHGALGAEAVDDTIDSGLGAEGTAPGVADVSDAAADTMGELVDLINASANWEAYLVDCLRSDDSKTLLLTLSAAQANKGLVPSGVRLYKDSSQNDNYDISLAIMNRQFPNGFTKTENKICRVFGAVETNTFGSGTSYYKVYEINPITKTETLVFQRSTAATTVQGTLSSADIDITSDEGNYLLVRMVSSAAAATGFLTVLGQVY